MPDSEDDVAGNAIVLAEALSEAMAKMSVHLDKLQKDKASKKTMLLVVISVILDVSLSVAVIFLGLGLSHGNAGISHQNALLAQQAGKLRSDERAICQNDNSIREEFLSLWKLNTEDFHDNPLGHSFLRVVDALYIKVDCRQ